MALKTDFGDGNLGDVVISEGLFTEINSYASVTSIDKNIIKIDLENASFGKWGLFHAGEQILIHVAATNGTDSALLGAFFIANIDLVDLNTLTLDIELPRIDLDYHYVQAITIAQFDCLTIKAGAEISPPPFNPFKYIGGVLAFKCFDTFTLEGNINLVDCGIPPARAGLLRPNKYQESPARGELDSGEMAGLENTNELILNAGDGAAFIAAQTFKCGGKIGNPATHGQAHCRGARDTQFKPSNITNIGGSTIILAAHNIINFDPRTFAKYRDASKDGKGLARCYIATETDIPADGQLYARDWISDPQRVMKLGVCNFGNAEFGNFQAANTHLANSAVITAIRGHCADYADKSIAGFAPFKVGALCLLKGDQFALARILYDDGQTLTFDFPVPKNAHTIYTVPQFDNVSASGEYRHNFYIAANQCDLRSCRLYGDTFILAKKLIVDQTTRLYRPAVIIADSIDGWNDYFLSAGNLIYCNSH